VVEELPYPDEQEAGARRDVADERAHGYRGQVYGVAGGK
jgi:hypothetical protein